MRSHSPGVWLFSCAQRVGHPEESLPFVWRADTVCSQYDRPDGVTRAFQVVAYKVEPTFGNCATNLLAKDSLRAALADEIEPHGPQMPFVVESTTFPRRGPWLAGRRSGPNVAKLIGDSGLPERERPSASPGEKVASAIASQIVRSNIGDRSLIHVAFGQMTRLDEVAQPSGDVGVIFVVVGRPRVRHLLPSAIFF
jgi:hypothetical protein